MVSNPPPPPPAAAAPLAVPITVAQTGTHTHTTSSIYILHMKKNKHAPTRVVRPSPIAGGAHHRGAQEGGGVHERLAGEPRVVEPLQGLDCFLVVFGRRVCC